MAKVETHEGIESSCAEQEPQVAVLRPGKGIYVYLPGDGVWQVFPEQKAGKQSDLDRLNDPRMYYKHLEIVTEKKFSRSKKLKSITLGLRRR